MRMLVARILAVLTCLIVAASAFADIIPLTRSAIPSPAEVRWRAGFAALGKGDLPSARREFEASLKLEPGGVGPRVGLAEIAIKQGDSARAHTLVAEAAERSADPASVHVVWGTFLQRYGRGREAEAAIKKALALEADNLAVHMALGDLHYAALNQPQQAVEHYRSATGIDVNHPGAHYGLGLALARTGKFAEALAALERARTLSPDNPLPSHGLGLVYLAQKRWREAEVEFSNAIKAFPGFARAYLERGGARAAVGNDQGAVDDFQAALTHDTSLALAHLQLAVVHHRQQRWAEAERHYTSTIRLAPQASVAYNNLAWMSAERKVRLSEALKWATTAVKLEPGVTEFRVTLGWVHRARGELAAAVEVLDTAARASKPASGTALYYLGVAQYEAGNRRAARHSFKQALAIEPNMLQAVDARRRLAEPSVP